MSNKGHVPLRLCRGCGNRLPQKELRRFVMVAGRLCESSVLDGRGVYCCFNELCWQRMRANKKMLRRVLRLDNNDDVVEDRSV